MSLSSNRPVVRAFNGLNNVADSLALDLSWFDRADNCVITERKRVRRASGFTLRASADDVTGAYATEDQQRFYLVDDGQLVQVNADFSRSVLASGLSSAPMRFTEVNGLVYFTNGADRGVIVNGQALAWGIEPPAGEPSLAVGTGNLAAGTYQVCFTYTDQRGIESGNGDVAIVTVPAGSSISIAPGPQQSGLALTAYVTTSNGKVFYALGSGDASLSYNCKPDALSEELPFSGIDPPRGTIPAVFAGQMYVAESIASADMSVVWPSLEMHYHHFYLGDGIAVPGTVRTLHGFDAGLLIGTDRAVFLYDGERIDRIADYGVVAGEHSFLFEKQLYFWTQRGMCRAVPFENMTQHNISVAPGVRAGATVLQEQGFRRYLVALQRGGTAYNQRRL